ncbi:hypothetical protein V8C86DRAFT_1158319 [Haematococcus lacustris]
MMVVIDTLLPLLLSCISYRLLVCCVISTPIVHLLGFYTLGVKHGSRSGSGLARLLLFPFSGGKRHAAFQLFGWGLWAASAIVSLPLWLSGPLSGLRQLRDALPNIPHTHVDVVSGAAAATSFVGQLFLVQALLVFEAAPAPSSTTSLAQPNPAFQHSPSPSRRGLPGQSLAIAAAGAVAARATGAGRAVARHSAAMAVVLCGLLLTLTGVLLLLSVEHLPDMPSRVLYCCLALICLIIGASSTHGLGGYLQWGSPDNLSAEADAFAAAAAAGVALSDSAPPSAPASLLATPQKSTVLCSPPPLPSDITAALLASPPGPLLTPPHPPSAKRSPSASGAPPPALPALSLGASCRDDGEGDLKWRGDGAGLQGQGPSPWAFFQPFAGGTAFVITQAVGWSLFALTAVAILGLAKSLVGGVLTCLRCWLLGASALMLATHVSLAVSLLLWRARHAAVRRRRRQRSLRKRVTPGHEPTATTPAGKEGPPAPTPSSAPPTPGAADSEALKIPPAAAAAGGGGGGRAAPIISVLTRRVKQLQLNRALGLPRPGPTAFADHQVQQQSGQAPGPAGTVLDLLSSASTQATPQPSQQVDDEVVASLLPGVGVAPGPAIAKQDGLRGWLWQPLVLMWLLLRHHVIDLHGPMVVMFLPIHCFFTFWVVTISCTPAPHWAVLAWLAAMPVYYSLSLIGEPQHTGTTTAHSPF